MPPALFGCFTFLVAFACVYHSDWIRNTGSSYIYKYICLYLSYSLYYIQVCVFSFFCEEKERKSVVKNFLFIFFFRGIHISWCLKMRNVMDVVVYGIYALLFALTNFVVDKMKRRSVFLNCEMVRWTLYTTGRHSIGKIYYSRRRCGVCIILRTEKKEKMYSSHVERGSKNVLFKNEMVKECG